MSSLHPINRTFWKNIKTSVIDEAFFIVVQINVLIIYKMCLFKDIESTIWLFSWIKFFVEIVYYLVWGKFNHVQLTNGPNACFCLLVNRLCAEHLVENTTGATLSHHVQLQAQVLIFELISLQLKLCNQFFLKSDQLFKNQPSPWKNLQQKKTFTSKEQQFSLTFWVKFFGFACLSFVPHLVLTVIVTVLW